MKSTFVIRDGKATRNYNTTKSPLAVKKSVMSTAAAAVDIFAKKGIQGL